MLSTGKLDHGVRVLLHSRSHAQDGAQQDLAFSQVTGKLDPGMRGPYRVLRVLPSSRYELKLLSGSYGKTTQAAAQFMVPWMGEWCPETCAAFFGDDDESVEFANPTDDTSDAGVRDEESPAAGRVQAADSDQPCTQDAQRGEAVPGPSTSANSLPFLESDRDT